MAWLGTRLGQRVLMGVCASAQVVSLLRRQPGTWAWWLPLGCLVALLALQGLLEWTRYGAQGRPPSLAERWELASQEDDPMAAMARMAYLDTLTLPQLGELQAYLRQGVAQRRVVELDDVPQVVKGFVLAGLPPEHREGL